MTFTLRWSDNFEMSFRCLQFPPTNEQKQVDLRFQCSKVEFISSFSGGNIYLKESFRLFLTFSKCQIKGEYFVDFLENINFTEPLSLRPLEGCKVQCTLGAITLFQSRHLNRNRTQQIKQSLPPSLMFFNLNF